MPQFKKKKSLPKSKGYYLFLFIVVMIALITILSISELASAFNKYESNYQNDYHWNIASINEFLGVSIPPDASSIEYSGHTRRGGRLNLSFEADSKEATEFVSTLCNDILYQSYDPFNAIDVSESTDNAHFIEIGNVSYYSYSLNTPPTTYGTRCFSTTGQIQVVLDKSNIDISSVKLEILFNCSKCQIP